MAMELPAGVELADLQRMLEMLKGTITGAAQLANRVNALEEVARDTQTGMTGLKDAQVELFEAHKAFVKNQEQLNKTILLAMQKLTSMVTSQIN